jgi:hypothetical protein
MIIKLIDVGRQKVNKQIQVASLHHALTEVEKHLMSREVELIETSDPTIYDVVVGGFRTVGKIAIMKNAIEKKVYSQKNLPKHIVRHSPDGFSWGYGGSGPSDLALALTTEALGKDKAEKCYMQFKEDVVAKFSDRWCVTTEQIQDWYIENYN